MPSTLIFPEASTSFKTERNAIRTELKDTYNRLHSILQDADFINDSVRSAFPDFPLVANQRAGAWYVKDGYPAHAYFKSTDGHINAWEFSLRRANLSLVPLIEKKQGIVLVDSTRRGKRFPDALSKTVPIWCAVLNRVRILLNPADDQTAKMWEENGQLFTLPSGVGPSEHSQIQSRIEAWAKSLAESSYDLSAIRNLSKPLRPIFVSPSSTLVTATASSFPDFIPVVCASASKLAAEADGMERASGFTYVQGSGDDHEAWSHGLSSSVLWENEFEISSASRQEIDQVIADILERTKPIATSSGTTRQIRSTGCFIDFGVAAETLPEECPACSVLIKGSKEIVQEEPMVKDEDRRWMTVKARTAKQGYHMFFNELVPSMLDWTEKGLFETGQVTILVESFEPRSEANDLGVALLICMLVRFFDDEGKRRDRGAVVKANKPMIRSRLQWILEEFDTINPHRATLNRVNDFLMSFRAP